MIHVCFDNDPPRQLRCECGAFLSTKWGPEGSILTSGNYYCKNPRCMLDWSEDD